MYEMLLILLNNIFTLLTNCKIWLFQVYIKFLWPTVTKLYKNDF